MVMRRGHAAYRFPVAESLVALPSLIQYFHGLGGGGVASFSGPECESPPKAFHLRPAQTP